jgi:hypothetical protein
VTDPARGSAAPARSSRGLVRAVLDDKDGPLPALLLALTVLAGVVDAVSILRLGHVFVATVTGNLVFLGLAAAGAKGFDVCTSALAVGGFIVGALIGARACQAARSHRGLALRNVLGVKTSLAGVVTAAAFISAHPSRPASATRSWCCWRSRWGPSSPRSAISRCPT